LYLWYWVLYLPYSKIQRLTARSRSQNQGRASSRPRPEIFEAKARGLRGQGQGHKILSSSCPRGRGQSLRSRPVLEDPIPATTSTGMLIYSAKAWQAKTSPCGVGGLMFISGIMSWQSERVGELVKKRGSIFFCKFTSHFHTYVKSNCVHVLGPTVLHTFFKNCFIFSHRLF